jgi:transcription elongation factor Elf1
MPKFRFLCEKCNNETIRYTPASVEKIKCGVCESDMDKQIPQSIPTPTVNELIDSYTGVSVPADNKSILESRRSEYFWKHEVPRLVQEYPTDHSLKEGWLYYDEQGKIQVQTKPPYKR